MNIGDIVTVTTKYGSLPGTHRGEIVERCSVWWKMRVWVACRGRHEDIYFSESQVVPPDTRTTDLSLSALHAYQYGARAAGVEP